MSYSDFGSKAAEGSSKTYKKAFLFKARKKAIFCDSPPESTVPSVLNSLERIVSHPCGHRFKISSTPIIFWYSSITSPNSLSKEMFSLMEKANNLKF